MKYYIGLSLASGSSMDSGLAIFDDSNNLIMVDKLYKMNDIIHFLTTILQQKIRKSAYQWHGTRPCLTANGEFCQNRIKWFQQIN